MNISSTQSYKLTSFFYGGLQYEGAILLRKPETQKGRNFKLMIGWISLKVFQRDFSGIFKLS
jgi:hypothetical protein